MLSGDRTVLRLMGAALVIAGPAISGFLAARRLARRPRVLRELIRALEQMEREITFRLTPLPQLFEYLAQSYRGPVGEMFSCCAEGMTGLGAMPVAQIWQNALRKSGLDLDSRSLRVMEELGTVLGQYDEQGLCMALERAGAELAAAAEQVEQEWERKSRMDQVLGLAAGAFLAILLI